MSTARPPVESAYRCANSSWRQGWRDSLDFNKMLSGFFDKILTTMQIPLLRWWLPSLFNTYRDQVRDRLSSVDPIGLPRFGQVPIPASDIFVHMYRFEGDLHLVSFKFTCNDRSHRPRTKGSSATFVLVVHSMSPAEHGLIEKPTLELWLSQVISTRYKPSHPSANCATYLALARCYRSFHSRGFGSTSPMGVINCLRCQQR